MFVLTWILSIALILAMFGLFLNVVTRKQGAVSDFGFLIAVAFGFIGLLAGLVLAAGAGVRINERRSCDEFERSSGLSTELRTTGALGWTCYVDIGDVSVPIDMLRYVDGRWEAEG